MRVEVCMLKSLILLSMLLFAGVAGAQAPLESEGDADVGLLEEARKAIRMDEHLRARSLFLELWQRRPAWDVAVALGGVESKLKDYPSAAYYLSYGLGSLPVSERGRPLEKRVRSRLKTARSHVTQLDLFLEPIDARVWVDGEEREAPIFLEPGEHRLTVKKPGYADFQREIVGSGGDVRRLNVELVPSGEVEVVEELNEAWPVEVEARRDPQVLLIGGGLAVGLGVVAVLVQSRAQGETQQQEQRLDELKREGAISSDSDCSGERAATADACGELLQFRQNAENRQNVAIALGIGAGVAVAATALTYLFWTEEVPIHASVSTKGASVGFRFAF